MKKSNCTSEFKQKEMFKKTDFQILEISGEKVLLVPDTHVGDVNQQLHLLNDIYDVAYKERISSVIFINDMIEDRYENCNQQNVKCYKKIKESSEFKKK